ncbi:far upstream element-binding protein 2 [Medicago truncatula]|uniref:RNA-binding KH domain protein n=1 Tax=Medicago truncatula TaxID=3880 RepID=G7K7W5_MEDTR|nr:far upstream element-binding protein 2 [Medicago truncatula]AES93870.2 RNA-binding KH domain protein [Medicago truncatula]
MAEEEVIVAAPATSPVSSDCKRKFEDLHSQPTESNTDGAETDAAAVAQDDVNKRPRLEDDNQNDLANTNGHQEKKVAEAETDTDTEENAPSEEVQDVSKDNSEETAEPTDTNEILVEDVKEIPVEDSGKENDKEPSKATEQPSKESTEQDASSGDKQPDSSSIDPTLQHDTSSGQKQPISGSDTTTRKIEVPSNKVGVLIGKSGDTIRYLQYNSGAKIQITRDADADPHSSTRPVELIGTLESIDKAEKLMNAVIAEADAGGSPALVARGLSPAQAIVGSDQIQIQVPNEKVGLIIGKGGETIKSLQTKTGARIQLIPQHLPEGDDSKERTVQVTGDKRQIEIAQEMIKEVLSQPIRSSSGGFGQQAYRPPRGSGGPPQWGQRGSHYGQPPSYDYQHRGPYPSHNQSYAPPPYGNYPQHMAPRSSYGSGWEQRPHQSFQGPPSHNGGYDYYGGQSGHSSEAPSSAQHPSSVPQHGTGPSPLPSMGPSPAQMNYNYGQPQGQDYGHQTPYQQAGHPQQGYGQGYDESKYENRGPAQYPYGGHSNPQPTYPQASAQANYAPPQQYGKPPLYGVPPSQGQHPQSYGHPRATQPGEIPYQGSTPAQSYGTVQQPYPYASSGPSQAAYPTYGSAPAADGYSHPQSAPGQVYAQPGGQPSYGQPGAQAVASYAQVGPTGYGSYPSSQQTYPEQPAPNSAGYGYQAPQDPAYSSGAAQTYSAAPTVQPGYVQPTPTQTGYDQSNPQPAGYAAVPPAAGAPAAYGKTVSPQPAAYAQYDSTQVYGAPR